MSAEGYGEADFEYDEGMGEADNEAGDEAFAAEGADEGDEAADERVFEADEGTDEADESATIGAMEADESDEADEAAEGFDVGYDMSASARLRAAEDRNRRAGWARRMAADQRLEAERAASAQRAIADRIRAIPITSRTRVATVGSLQGAGVVTAILPNGRRTRMRIVPTVAPISEVNRLRSVVLANERRQANAIATNAKAVSSLATAQSSSMQKLMAQQVKSDADLSKRVVEGDNRLDARITKELSGGSGILDRHNKRMLRVIRRERRRAMMNNVLLATSTPFFLAYGDRETPFTIDNAIIAGSTLFWLLGDDVISSWSANKGFMQGLASVWSYGAPIANGGGLYWWFRNKQNQRFLVGVSAVPIAGGATTGSFSTSVNGLIKKDSLAAFNANEHPVVASFAKDGASGAVTAALDKTGNLKLTIVGATAPGAATTMDVAWIVDTQAPAKP